jgi:hypothetical protein
MEDMGFDLIRIFGCYFILKRGERLDSRAKRGERWRSNFSCSFVSLRAYL